MYFNFAFEGYLDKHYPRYLAASKNYKNICFIFDSAVKNLILKAFPFQGKYLSIFVFG